MIKAQYINLNMIPSGVMPVLYCSQYDVGRPLGMVVYNGSEAVDLSTYAVTIEGTRTDGTPITAAVTTDENIAAFETTATMTNVPDFYKAQLVITDGSGKRVASIRFMMKVNEAAMNENSEGIQEDASLYQQYTGTVQTLISAVRADLLAEANRAQAAEAAEASARASADASLQSAIASEASTRAAADQNLQAQINQIIAPSGEAPSAAEVQNARIGANNVTYPTLGDAIRGQVTDLKNQIGDGYIVRQLYLPSSSSSTVGRWWNTNIAHHVSQGEKFKFCLKSYTGSLFTSCAVGYVDSGGNLHAFKSGMVIGTEYEITASANAETLYVQIVRSANEYDVYAQVDFQFKTSDGLYGMILNHSEEIDTNANKVTRLTDGLDASSTVSESSRNYFVYYPFKAGDVVTVENHFSGTTSDSGQRNLTVNDDSNTRLGVIYFSGTQTYTLPTDTAYLKIALNSTGTWDGLSAAITVSVNSEFETFAADVEDQIGSINAGRVYHVEKDGSGDFTSLVEAIAAAEQYDGSTVYVGAGTWDILAELGEDYLNAVSSDPSTWGVELKNNIHLIFSTQAVVTANYTGTNTNVMKYLSVFNSGEKGFTLENCTIRSSKIRYCVHDDRGSMTTPYRNRYINCDMYHDASENTAFGGWQCIGGGFGYNGDIDIEGCYFDAHNQYSDWGGVVSFHNSAQANAQSKLTIKNCYCAGHFTFRVSWYGNTEKVSKVYISGCSMGQEIAHNAESSSYDVRNTEVIAWNNEIRSA